MRRVNPDCAILPVSARTGEGLEAWIGWIDEVRTAASAVHPAAAE
jgi:hydrogenase nickel incorporation protein HypB